MVWAAFVARLVVGAVMLVAGALKLPDPAASVRAVAAYQILPEGLEQVIGYTLPILEVITGVCLVLGLLTRTSAIIAALLMAVFVAGIISVWVRGIEIDCGCFGGGGEKPGATEEYPWEIARDAGLLALSVFIAWVRPHRLALDNLLFHRSTERTAPHGQEQPEPL